MLARSSALLSLAALFLLTLPPAFAQQATKANVPGVTNFVRLETTVACAGETTPQAVPEIKKLGYASIINLREPTEEGANMEAEAQAAKEANIRYFSIPFNGRSPQAAAADRFIATITAPGNEPAYIHCHSGNRAAAMWMIKRIVVDHWDTDRADKEATALGVTSPVLKKFAIDYAESHKR